MCYFNYCLRKFYLFKIEYEEKIYIDKIDIYETYHAGMVKCIKAKHPNGSWVKVWNTPKVSCITHSRIFSPDFEVKLCRKKSNIKRLNLPILKA